MFETKRRAYCQFIVDLISLPCWWAVSVAGAVCPWTRTPEGKPPDPEAYASAAVAAAAAAVAVAAAAVAAVAAAAAAGVAVAAAGCGPAGRCSLYLR